jgi:cytosine/adenosine deaminase-related metal-dependent hydrolase
MQRHAARRVADVTVLAADWVLPMDAPAIEHGAVAFDAGRITAVGPVDQVGPPDETYEDSVILPGFVNAHSHLEYAVYAGFGDGLAFGEWLLTHVERKRQVDWDGHLAIARVGAAQSLASGIATTADASFTGAAAVASVELGLRALVHLEVFGHEADAVARFEEKYERVRDVVGGLVSIGVSPHAPYTVSPELYEACNALGLSVATHLAESEDEQLWVSSGSGPWSELAHLLGAPYGTTAIRRLADYGVLNERVVAAHCVHVDEDEIALLADHDVAVAHCPRSNAALGCGIAPLRGLLDAGLRVGIGTDSPASTPSFDMFDELRTAVYAARAREQRADALAAAEALELATLGGARALRLEHEIGSLTAGKRADLVAVSLAASPYVPWEDPAAAVVFGGSPQRVLLTVVEGQVRYENGVTGWHELIDAAASVRGRMLAGASQPHALPERL